MVKVPLSARRYNERPVLPSGSAVLIRETNDGLGIYNPARRKPFLLLFLAVWLFMWSMGFRFGLSVTLQGGVPGVLVAVIWMPVWSIAGIAVCWLLGWYAFGWERLFITEGVLIHARGIGPVKRMKAYALSEITDFRIDPRTNVNSNGMPVAALQYTTPKGRRSFGIEMSRQEAQAALDAIRRHIEYGKTA